MRFRLVPKSVTLDDLERPLRDLSILFQNTCVFGAHHENLNQVLLHPYYQQPRCSPMTLVWQYKACADIRGGFPEEGRQTTVGLSKTAIFNTFTRYFFRSFSGKANIIVQQAYYSVPRRIYADSKTKIRERSFYVKFCFVLSSQVQNFFHIFFVYRKRHYIYSRHK